MSVKKWMGILILGLLSLPLHADDTIDEASLFDESSQKVEQSQSTDITLFNAERSVNFSGRIESFNAVQGGKEALQGHASDTTIYSLNQADLFLDVRLPKQIKTFANFSISHSSTGSSATANASQVFATVKELFLDYNFERKVYVRTGKQFIRWGRGYFWNPTDFINTNQRNFVNLDALRSGVNGTRIHFPGQNKNTYIFVDINEASRLDQCRLLIKHEEVIGMTEIGTSIWTSPHKATRFGLDMSTHIKSIDVSGEWSLDNRKNGQRVVLTNAGADVEGGPSEWHSSAVITLQKQFNWQRPNRITTLYEFFYNGMGYSDDILKNTSARTALFANNLYQENRLSTYYHALFLSINEYPFYPTILTVNCLQNLTDKSAILSTGLTYKLTDGLQLTTSVLAYLGNKNTEYKLSGNSAALIVQGIVTF